MRILFIVLATMLAAMAGCTSAPTRTDWETCKTNTDCIVVKGPCYMPKAIHREATGAFESYKEKVEETYSCAFDGKAQWTEEIAPSCNHGKCTPVYSRKITNPK